MPASKEKQRAVRYTLTSRNKTTAKKISTLKSKVDSVNSPGWVTGHPDLFKIPEFSPRRTRRSSVYQKAGSPSRYRNAKVPGSNCRKNRSLKTSSNSLPINSGVVTRSRRSSSIYVNRASLLITVLSPEQEKIIMVKPPSKAQSLKSATSRSSIASTDSKKPQEFSMFCPERFVAPPGDNFVLPEFPEGSECPSGEYSDPLTSSQEMVYERMLASQSKGSMGSEMMSASRRSSLRSMTSSGRGSGVSMTSIKSKDYSNSLPVKSMTSEETSKISLSPVNSLNENRSHTSLSPNCSDFVMLPCNSDTEISFNTSRHGIQTPDSRQSLKSPEINHEVGNSNSYRVSCPNSKHYIGTPHNDAGTQSSRHLLSTPQSRHDANTQVSAYNVSTPQSQHDATVSDTRQTRSRSQSRQASRHQSKQELCELENSPMPSCSQSRDDTSTPQKRHKLRTPQSKRFLEALGDSPAPVATKSFQPPPQKMLKLSLPAIASSEKFLSGISECSEASLLNTKNPFDIKSPSLQSSSRRISQVDFNITPAGSEREVTLRDISNSQICLDSTTAMETFQTPMANNRMCAESETFYETPRVVMDHTDETLDSTDVTNLDQSSKLEDKTRRCIIL